MRFEVFRAAIFVGAFVALGACNGPGGSSDANAGISCDNVATMSLCLEYPNPTTAQQTNVPSACSSTSGTFSTTAACPTAGFQGKCTIPPSSGGMDGIEVKRFYNLSSSDLAYQADFCATVAHGVWSTTF